MKKESRRGVAGGVTGVAGVLRVSQGCYGCCRGVTVVAGVLRTCAGQCDDGEIDTYINTHTRTHAYTHIHNTYTYTHTHTHTHTNTNSCAGQWDDGEMEIVTMVSQGCNRGEIECYVPALVSEIMER
jgi:hypothetical protein